MNSTPPKKPTLPEYNRGYIAGLLDAKALVDQLAIEMKCPEGPDGDTILTIRDAIEVSKNNFEIISQGFADKAKIAEETAYKMLTSPNVEGQG